MTIKQFISISFFSIYFLIGCTNKTEELRKNAEEGNINAQYELAKLYLNGARGFKPDQKQAFLWFEKAAEQGHPEAQYETGVFYKGGKFSRNGELAYKYFKLSAEQGNKNAQNELGRIYRFGSDDAKVSPNKKKSIECFTKAAKQNHEESLFFLGVMYEHGEGLKKDISKAAGFYKKAANLGHVHSQLYIGKMYCEGNGVEKNLDSAAFYVNKSIELAKKMECETCENDAKKVWDDYYLWKYLME